MKGNKKGSCRCDVSDCSFASSGLIASPEKTEVMDLAPAGRDPPQALMKASTKKGAQGTSLLLPMLRFKTDTTPKSERRSGSTGLLMRRLLLAVLSAKFRKGARDHLSRAQPQVSISPSFISHGQHLPAWHRTPLSTWTNCRGTRCWLLNIFLLAEWQVGEKGQARRDFVL